MAIGNFIKNNLALVAGLAVPVVLVVGFLISAQVGRLVNDPPRHLAYFVIENRTDGGDTSLNLDVNPDGRVSARLSAVTTNVNSGYRPPAQQDVLISYDFTTGKIEELPITPPQDQTTGVFLPENLAQLRVNKSPIAPDGYALSYGAGRHGFVGDVFSYNYGYNYRARKGAAVYRFNDSIPTGQAYRYYAPSQSARFLGWSTEPHNPGNSAP